MDRLRLGVIGDPGASRYDSSRFYAYPGGGWRRKSRDGINGANRNVNSSGPAQSAVAEQLRDRSVDAILASATSCTTRAPAPTTTRRWGASSTTSWRPIPPPTTRIAAAPTARSGAGACGPSTSTTPPTATPTPSPAAGAAAPMGGTVLAHARQPRVLPAGGRSETNISLDTPGSTVPNREVIGRSSTAVPQPYVDYFAWLRDPGLIRNRRQLRIGEADASGNRGIYYRVSLGKAPGAAAGGCVLARHDAAHDERGRLLPLLHQWLRGGRAPPRPRLQPRVRPHPSAHRRQSDVTVAANSSDPRTAGGSSAGCGGS